MTQPSSGNAGLHVRWEKAGLVLDALPIPWNADAVIVEAIVRLPAKAACDKHDFTLRVGDGAATSAELVVRGEGRTPARVLFRVPTPTQSCAGCVSWREHVLGQVEVPIIARPAYLDAVSLEMPTIHALIGTHAIACSAFVNTQAKQLLASAVVRGSGPLAAAQDLDLRLEIEHVHAGPTDAVLIAFTNEQRRARVASVSAALPKLRSVGSYRVSWHVGARLLHAQQVRCVSKKTFLRSLRISATRFVVERENDAIETVRTLPARDGQLLTDGIRRVVPCFFVSSGEAGLAGTAPFTVRALVDDMLTTLAIEDDVLITDGPTPVLLGSVAGGDLPRIKHFTLCCGDIKLGNLALLPAPAADFTAEGGFAALDDYLWSAAAEEQLGDRLGKLLGGE